MSAPHTVRELRAADLDRVLPWLTPGAARELPQPGDPEAWLGVQGPGDDAGLCAALRLRQRIGLQLPRPWYHVGCVVHAAPALALFHRLTRLQLGHDHSGASELADIAWDPALPLPEQAAALQALLAAALARIQARRDEHAATLIVELPGLRDGDGASPFWQGLGRHFYSGDTRAAAERFGPAWRSHVAALLPRQPVYTAFLPAPAQAAIAQVAPGARVLLELLWQAGFRYSHHITVDDGGPVFELALDALPAQAAAL